MMYGGREAKHRLVGEGLGCTNESPRQKQAEAQSNAGQGPVGAHGQEDPLLGQGKVGRGGSFLNAHLFVGGPGIGSSPRHQDRGAAPGPAAGAASKAAGVPRGH
jgi:hypothetical protein